MFERHMRRILVLVAAFVAIANVPRADAQPSSEFYRSKQIRLVIGSDVGGAYDAYARLVARHMPKYIPGEPSFLVQNLPGAGSMVALNHVSNIAPKDGTVIAAIHADTVLAPLFHPDKAKFDARRLNWLGAPVTMSYTIAVWHTAPVQALDQIFKTELIVAASGGNSITLPLLTNALLGTKFKIVRGYKSSAAALLAIERGEAEGIAGNAVGFLKLVAASNLRDNKLRIIGSFALRPTAELSGVPLVMDYAKTPEQREALALILAEQDFGWPFVMAPDIPTDRVQVMRDAFDATMKDPAFLADAQKGGLEITPTRGLDQAALINQAFNTSKEIVEQVKRVVGE
jgi:tripartite-type tricarboxylate transporter receptor subunit TctC